MKILILSFFLFTCAISVTWYSLNHELDIIAQRSLRTRTKPETQPAEIDRLWKLYTNLHGGLLLSSPQMKLQFAKNVQNVLQNNGQFYNGEKKFLTGINKYSHMSPSEFNRTMNGFRKSKLLKFSGKLHQPQGGDCLQDVDWRVLGAVTPVKDQGTCGSCYAFSSTGSIEGQYAVKTKTLISLSNQQLVDCTNGYGNYGCDGGLMDTCFNAIRESGGIQSESSYPYKGKVSTCRFDPNQVVTSCDGHVSIPEGDEQMLMDAVKNIGPIAIAIDASSEDLMSYRSGVYYDNKCKAANINHAVLLVGYGTEIVNGKQTPYWLVKNSWGETWGDRGYVKMARFADNMCGIASYALYPTLKYSKSVPQACNCSSRISYKAKQVVPL